MRQCLLLPRTQSPDGGQGDSKATPINRSTRITICADVSKALNSIAAVSADGSTVCVLLTFVFALELFMQTFNSIGNRYEMSGAEFPPWFA